MCDNITRNSINSTWDILGSDKIIATAIYPSACIANWITHIDPSLSISHVCREHANNDVLDGYWTLLTICIDIRIILESLCVESVVTGNTYYMQASICFRYRHHKSAPLSMIYTSDPGGNGINP